MILVVGSTGALGGMITRELLAGGREVRVLVRPGSNYGPLVDLGAQPVMGDLRDPASLDRACAGTTAVISTANSAARGEPDTVDVVDRRGNRALIDAAVAAGTEHFIFVSALGASEQSPVDFFQAKGETERHLEASGLTYTILQPNIFMEVWIGMLVGMPLQQNMPVTLIGQGDHRHSMISMRDVAAYAVAAVSNRAARDRTLVLGGPEARTWTEVVKLAESVLGRSLDLRYVEPGQPLPGLPPIASELGAALESYESVIDMSELSATFGVKPTTFDEYMREAFASVDA